jgi:ParB family transcriptional regulator, chromosome partitioning protein
MALACSDPDSTLSCKNENVPRGTFTNPISPTRGKGVPVSNTTQQSIKNKPRLGRGLSSLISVSDLPVEAEIPPVRLDQPAPAIPSPTESVEGQLAEPMGVRPLEIPVDQIVPNPHQPRREMNDASLAELAASLKSTGLIQPIVVRKSETGYQLIAGERRLRASKLAGLKTIPAIIREVDGFTQAQMALVENIQREDLNPIDRANAYRTLISQLGLTQVELATRLGEDRSVIGHFVRLLDMAEPVRELVRIGKLSLGHAKLLARVEDLLEQQRLAELCVTQDLSVRNLERMLAGQETQAAPTRAPSVSAHLLDLEKSIARQLGMRVQVRSNKKGKGKMVIHYANLDQFDDLIKRMGVKIEE